MPTVPLAVNWAVRVAGVVCVVAVVKERFGTTACFAAMVGMFVAGFLPPVFPLLYRAYTTRAVGYRARHVLHPRLPSHSTTVFGARRLVAEGTSALAPGVLIVPIPVLADNYSYLIGCERTHTCAVVDPADPARVQEVAKELGYTITMVLTTHKHWDHAGGNDELRAALPSSVAFIGSEEDRPAACNVLVTDGALVRLGEMEISAHATPGHTTGHMVYKVRHAPTVAAAAAAADDDNHGSFAPVTRHVLAAVEQLCCFPSAVLANPKDPRVAGFTERLAHPIPTVTGSLALFTGDCIFCGGCGAMFECRAATDVLHTYDVLHTLHTVAPEGLCFVGHEYTQRLFAEMVERDHGNAGLRQRYAEVCAARRRFDCTVPTTLADEAATNPLMTLARDELVRMATIRSTPAEVESAVYLSKQRRRPQ